MIIGLTGTLGSGKGAILEYLQSMGFKHHSTSNEVRKEAKLRGIEITRTALQNLGNEIREKEGGSALIGRILKKMDPYELNIIDGIRNPAEVRELKKLPNFFLIAIDAPKKIRFQRLLERNRESDPKTWEEFLEIDSRDQGKNETKNGQQSSACAEMADFNIYNDGNLEDNFERIRDIIDEIKRKSGHW